MNDKPIILLVDDDDINLQILGVMLSESAKLMVANSPERALKALEKRIPDVIITDVQMPGMNGFELAQNIRQKTETASTPIIFISSDMTEEANQTAQAIAHTRYLLKPFDKEKIFEAIDCFIQQS